LFCRGIKEKNLLDPLPGTGSSPQPNQHQWAGHEAALERVFAVPGVVFLVGGMDTGKTTFGIDLAARAVAAGIPTAIVDADIGQSTVGPPTTVGLKLCSGMGNVARESIRDADGLGFVGALTPAGHMLPLVTGTAKLVARAMAADCKLVIIDTTGSVSGVAGQLQKFSKMDLAPPDIVIAFSRGGELEPILGHTRRFTTAEVIELEVPEAVDTRSVEERTTYRERQFAAYFQAGLSRWRIKPQVFMPSLPPEFDLALLDGIVVGMEDGKGSCVGIGVLENGGARDTLKMVSPVTEGVKGLRLGSIRISTNGRSRGPVNLRNLFQTE